MRRTTEAANGCGGRQWCLSPERRQLGLVKRASGMSLQSVDPPCMADSERATVLLLAVAPAVDGPRRSFIFVADSEHFEELPQR